MELGTFTPRTSDENFGDKFTAKDAIDRPLIVLVREHRTGIKTKFNSNPADKSYKPEGGDGVTVDVADVRTDEVWIDVLWMNGAVVDNLTAYLGQPVAVKLVWQASAKGGNAYITVVPLEGQELALAKQWATTNPNRFDTERVTRAATAEQEATATAGASTGATALPTLPTQPTPEAETDPTKNPQVLALIAQLQAEQSKAS